MIKTEKQLRYKGIRVTGVDGISEVFDTVKKAASAIGVTTQYVYIGLNSGRLVAGCKVEEVNEHGASEDL